MKRKRRNNSTKQINKKRNQDSFSISNLKIKTIMNNSKTKEKKNRAKLKIEDLNFPPHYEKNKKKIIDFENGIHEDLLFYIFSFLNLRSIFAILTILNKTLLNKYLIYICTTNLENRFKELNFTEFKRTRKLTNLLIGLEIIHTPPIDHFVGMYEMNLRSKKTKLYSELKTKKGEIINPNDNTNEVNEYLEKELIKEFKDRNLMFIDYSLIKIDPDNRPLYITDAGIIMLSLKIWKNIEILWLPKLRSLSLYSSERYYIRRTKNLQKIISQTIIETNEDSVPDMRMKQDKKVFLTDELLITLQKREPDQKKIQTINLSPISEKSYFNAFNIDKLERGIYFITKFCKIKKKIINIKEDLNVFLNEEKHEKKVLLNATCKTHYQLFYDFILKKTKKNKKFIFDFNSLMIKELVNNRRINKRKLTLLILIHIETAIKRTKVIIPEKIFLRFFREGEIFNENFEIKDNDLFKRMTRIFKSKNLILPDKLQKNILILSKKITRNVLKLNPNPELFNYLKLDTKMTEDNFKDLKERSEYFLKNTKMIEVINLFLGKNNYEDLIRRLYCIKNEILDHEEQDEKIKDFLNNLYKENIFIHSFIFNCCLKE